MKAFNKLFSLVVASVLVFSLAGCGDKEESKKFSANLNGTEIAITYVYKGDKVLKPKFNLLLLVQPPKKTLPRHLSR